MVRIIVAIALALAALGGGTAYASQASLPGDALYSVKLGMEQAGMMLPGDDAARAERGLTFADRRIEEMEALVEQGRPEDVDVALEKYAYALDMTLDRIEEAMSKGLAAGDVMALVAEATAKHVSVLDTVYGTVPEEAQSAIALAMGNALTGHDRAIEALGQAGVDVSELAGIPEDVRERVEDILGGIPPTTPGPGGQPEG